MSVGEERVREPSEPCLSFGLYTFTWDATLGKCRGFNWFNSIMLLHAILFLYVNPLICLSPWVHGRMSRPLIDKAL